MYAVIAVLVMIARRAAATTAAAFANTVTDGAEYEEQ